MATIKAHISVLYRHPNLKTQVDRVICGFAGEDRGRVDGILGHTDEEGRTGVSVVVDLKNECVYLRGGAGLPHQLSFKGGQFSGQGKKRKKGPDTYEVSLDNTQLPVISKMPTFGRDWVDAEVLDGQICIPFVLEDERRPPRTFNRRTKKEIEEAKAIAKRVGVDNPDEIASRVVDKIHEVTSGIVEKLGERAPAMAASQQPYSTNLYLTTPDGGEITASFDFRRVLDFVRWMDIQGQEYNHRGPETLRTGQVAR